MRNSRVAIPALMAGVTVIVLAVGLSFSAFVHDSLWEKSVTDILEVTIQGGHALDTYIKKDLDTLDLLANDLSDWDPADADGIVKTLSLFTSQDEGSVYQCLSLEAKKSYRIDGQPDTVSDEHIEEIRKADGHGALRPFQDQLTGVNMVGAYSKVTFADGSAGLVSKTHPMEEVADEFLVSFFNDSGFSYVMDREGNILIRSSHRNSNRTMSSVYDIVKNEGNDPAVIASFSEAIEQGKQGTALFSYQGEDYTFCYTPLTVADGWYLISIIPNGVVMSQAHAILIATFALCGIIVVGLLLVLYVYWRNSRSHRKHIEQIAYYDKLTGLYSPEKMELEGNRLLAELKDGEPQEDGCAGLAVAYLNIADFKLINEVDGYQTGDEVLRKTSGILRDACGEDGCAGRVSADHFLLMRPYRSEEEARKWCEAVAASIREIVAVGKPIIPHLGLYCSPSGENAAMNELIDRARLAKTEGQKAGEAVCLFDRSMREAMLRRADLERSMDEALSNGEFFALVQPKFSKDGECVLGGEALARWNRPREGIISPAEFVPVFEQSGSIIQLDKYLFELVCRDLREQLDAGLPVVPVSINISRTHLYRPKFVPEYLRIKEEYRIPEGLCELELTESMVLDDIGNAARVIARLREAGFSCSIDDFGSGQSSLNALKELPVNVIKLDRSFMLGQLHSVKDRIVVESVIEMARRLDMKTVVEGVETPEQLAFIQSTACDMVQGFVFSLPIPTDEFHALVERKCGPLPDAR